jgi:predicted metalloprotease
LAAYGKTGGQTVGEGTLNRLLRTLSVMILLASLELYAVACGGGASETPGVEEVDRKDLLNPAAQGEDVLANLPEVNPPLVASDPRIVGSQNMTPEEFVQNIGGDLNAKWQALFEEAGYAYSNAGLVAYNHPIPIAGCRGIADPKLGPFYCPENMTVYYPLSWRGRGGQTAAEVGDFAVAVILAHEVGHHVQHLIGIGQDPSLYTIHRELQADCLAGVWARSIYEEGLLEPGDVKEAIRVLANAADLPGTPPKSLGAHGTEAQRADAFFTGYESGRGGQCNF